MKNSEVRRGTEIQGTCGVITRETETGRDLTSFFHSNTIIDDYGFNILRSLRLS